MEMKAAETGCKPYQPTSYEISWYIFLFVIFTAVLKFSQDAFLPIFAGLILYFCFCPVVDKLQTFKVSRWISSFMIVTMLGATAFTGLYYLASPVYDILQTSGSSLKVLEQKLTFLKQPMQKITAAEKEVERLTETDGQKVMQVTVQEGSMTESLFYGVQNFALTFFTIVVIFFFLLIYGDVLFCKLKRVLPYGRESDFEGSLLHKIQHGTCYYLFAITCINTILGCAIGGALYVQGFPNAFLWGAVGGILNFIPYVGCIVGASLVFLITLSTSPNGAELFMPALTYFLINTIEGQFITPTVVGKALRLNPLVILLALIYWGSIWGVAGMFIAIPVLIVMQIIGTYSTHLKDWTEALQL